MTQTRKEALTELLERVEAGGGHLVLPDFKDALNTSPKHSAANAWDAYQGSLDAAKALHEAVLPDFDAAVYLSGSAWIYIPTRGAPPTREQHADNTFPARALLIADLKELIAQEPDQ